MGLRGKLPAVLKALPEPLSDLSAPDWLSDLAQEYHARHAKSCAESGLLTDATAESFYLLCDLWGRVRDSANDTEKVFQDKQKAFVSLAKQFRRLPTEAPPKPVANRHANRPAFSFNGKPTEEKPAS